MPTFLLIEDGEEFTIEAANMAAARQDAVMWNAEVIRELDEDEEDSEPEYDGQPDEAQEWHDFDPDCQEYIMPVNDKGNECCPKCEKEEYIKWGGIDGGYDNGQAREHVECINCGCSWEKVYEQIHEEYTSGGKIA